jgi:hypothetical protein
MLQQVDLHMLAPQLNDHFFDSWWERTSEAASGLKKEGINSLIILGFGRYVTTPQFSPELEGH